MSSPTEAKCERNDLHVDLDNSINSIETLVGHLTNLQHRINGEDVTEEPAVLRGQNTLEAVLHGGAGRINVTVGEAHELIFKIEDTLF